MTWRVTLSCGCIFDTEEQPHVGKDRFKCPGTEEHAVMMVRRLRDETEEEKEG